MRLRQHLFFSYVGFFRETLFLFLPVCFFIVFLPKVVGEEQTRDILRLFISGHNFSETMDRVSTSPPTVSSEAEKYGVLQEDGSLKPLDLKIRLLTHFVMRLGRYKE
jgi:hypothetical protein